MLNPQEAETRIRETFSLWESEWIPFDQAEGRVLRRSILADRDLPPYDRVMMDGIAVDWERAETALRGEGLKLSGTVFAGEPERTLNLEDRGVEIMTGAVLPRGVNTVIPREALTWKEEQVALQPDSEVSPGQFVHRRGSDFGKGFVLVEAGCALSSRELAVAASVGKVELEVSCLPRVGLVSTGDELVDPGDEVAPHQIRRSNTHALAAMLRASGSGIPTLAHFKDDRKSLLEGLAGLLASCDVLVLSGGVSKGKKDFVPEVLTELGVGQRFHRVAQKPGKPMWFGWHEEQAKAVFGLPGNPLSTLVCAHRYLLPYLHRRAGLKARHSRPVILGAPFKFEPELTLFLPISLEPNDQGELVAMPRPVQNSGDYASVVVTDGFVELPSGLTDFSTGSLLTFYPWS